MQVHEQTIFQSIHTPSSCAGAGSLSQYQLSISSSAIKSEERDTTMPSEAPNKAAPRIKAILGSLAASASEIGARNDEECNPKPLDIKLLRQLISDNSFDLAIELLGRGSHEVFGIENGDGYQLLSLAVKVIPSSNAVLLVEALINAG